METKLLWNAPSVTPLLPYGKMFLLVFGEWQYMVARYDTDTLRFFIDDTFIENDENFKWAELPMRVT